MTFLYFQCGFPKRSLKTSVVISPARRQVYFHTNKHVLFYNTFLQGTHHSRTYALLTHTHSHGRTHTHTKYSEIQADFKCETVRIKRREKMADDESLTESCQKWIVFAVKCQKC